MLKEKKYYEGIYRIIEKHVIFKPTTKAEFRKAIRFSGFNNWADYKNSNSTHRQNEQSILKYGPIEIWNTSLMVWTHIDLYNGPPLPPLPLSVIGLHLHPHKYYIN